MAGEGNAALGALLRRCLPGLLVVVAGTWLLLRNGVGAQGIAVYGAYLLLAVLGPGILVSRAVLGRSPLLVAELGTGGVAGLLLTLPAWALATAAGRGDLLRWWPLVVYALFLLVPGLRGHWRFQRYPERLSPLVAWTMAAAVVIAGAPFRVSFPWTRPFLGTTQWPVDMHWHLSLVELFCRQVRPEEAQVSGSPLAYHWFADADIAAASLATGIDPALVLSRLWVLPVIALTFATIVSALRELAPLGARAAGLASLLIAAPAGLEVFRWLDVPWDPLFPSWSPSQNYSYPYLLVTVVLIVRYLRRGHRRDLVPLGVLLVVSPAVKASTLPVLLSGLLLATVVAALRRGAWRRPALLAAIAGAALVVGTAAFGAGGAAGSGARLLSTLSRLPVYYRGLGQRATEAAARPEGWLPPGLDVPGMRSILALLLLAILLKYAWILPGLPLLRGGGERFDAAAWTLFGGGLGGWLLVNLVDQSGLSQFFFLGAGAVLWALLSAWGMVVLWDRTTARYGARTTTRWAVAGAVLGVALGVAVVARAAAVRGWASRDGVFSASLPPPGQTVAGLLAGLLPLALLLALAVGYVLLRRAHRTGTALRALAVLSGVLAASLVLNPLVSGSGRPAPTPTRWAVSPSELQAARWVADHAAPHDVVATNVHCLTPRASGLCDARAFWVSSLTRRRAFIGAWAYYDDVRAMGTEGGVVQALQPFPDPARFALNEALFKEPTPAVAAALVGQGVRWAYADRRRTTVSPELAGVADLVFSNDQVDVYELHR